LRGNPAPPAKAPKARRPEEGRGHAANCEVEFTEVETIIIKAVAQYQSDHHIRFMTLRDYIACLDKKGWLNAAAITLESRDPCARIPTS
jgi:hypothetical protein